TTRRGSGRGSGNAQSDRRTHGRWQMKLIALQGLLGIVGATLLIACGSPPISPELRTARDAYAEAQESPAAELAPADLDSARQARDRAEQAFKNDHKHPAVKDYSYIAERAAQYAVVSGLIEKEKRERKELKNKLEKLEKSRASMTAQELEEARMELAEK